MKTVSNSVFMFLMEMILSISALMLVSDHACFVASVPLKKFKRNHVMQHSHQPIFFSFLKTEIKPSLTAALIKKTKNMPGTKEEKATFLSNSLIELISHVDVKRPSNVEAAGTSTLDDMNIDGSVGEGSNAEEGLADETPQCFAQMKSLFGGLFGCLSGLNDKACCEGEAKSWDDGGPPVHGNGIIQHAVTHVRSWLQ